MAEPTITTPESIISDPGVAPLVSGVNNWMRMYFRGSPEPITATWGTVFGSNGILYVTLDLTLDALPDPERQIFIADELSIRQLAESGIKSALIALLGRRSKQILDGLSEARSQAVEVA